MIYAIRPWFGLVFGGALIIHGVCLAVRPDRFVGSGVIPISVPRIIQLLGVVTMVTGGDILVRNISLIVSE